MRRFLVLVAALAAVVIVATGCGSDSSADSAVKVETGSLSKAEFVKRANAICESVRTQFLNEYTAFYKKNEPKDESETLKVLTEATEKLIVPNYGTRMVNQIAALGAPEEMVDGVTEFLQTVEHQIEEFEEEPEILTETAFPFKASSQAAEAAGLKGCAGAFS
jgi:hypothetical protein